MSDNEENYRVRLENVFEGPMDLLVYLIKKNEVDIYDIPISLIADQFLEYLDWMKSLNIDVAGDFLYMAALLTQIKSKMLLPVHLDDDGEEMEDPRSEITGPLIGYLQLKSATEELQERKILGVDTFTRPNINEYFPKETTNELIPVGLFELIDAFQKILSKNYGKETLQLSTERQSVKDRMTEIVDILEEKTSVTFTELFQSQHDRSDIVVTFLAILELAKLYLIKIVQHTESGIIRLFYR